MKKIILLLALLLSSCSAITIFNNNITFNNVRKNCMPVAVQTLVIDSTMFKAVLTKNCLNVKEMLTIMWIVNNENTELAARIAAEHFLATHAVITGIQYTTEFLIADKELINNNGKEITVWVHIYKMKEINANN